MILLIGEEDHSYLNISIIISDSITLIDIVQTSIIIHQAALFLTINGIMLLLLLIIRLENYISMFMKMDNLNGLTL